MVPILQQEQRQIAVVGVASAALSVSLIVSGMQLGGSSVEGPNFPLSLTVASGGESY